MLFNSFKKFIADNGLISDGDRIVVAVSGGIDSMVLLDLLCRLAGTHGLEVMAAHINHGLRGKDSDLDEMLVHERSEHYGIRCLAKQKKPVGENIQDCARRIRYDFLEMVARKFLAGSIAVAHHMDDQAETVLIHLLRGTGLRGLVGMRPLARIGEMNLIRPLLATPRYDIETYAEARHIPYRDDRTNAGEKYLRNRIRHKLLPLLCEFNPKIALHLASLADRLADDDEALELVAKTSLDSILTNSRKSGLSFNRKVFISLPSSIRKRLLREAFVRASGDAKDLNADQIAKMDHIALSPKGMASYRLPSRWRFERNDNSLYLRRMRTSCDR